MDGSMAATAGPGQAPGGELGFQLGTLCHGGGVFRTAGEVGDCRLLFFFGQGIVRLNGGDLGLKPGNQRVVGLNTCLQALQGSQLLPGSFHPAVCPVDAVLKTLQQRQYGLQLRLGGLHLFQLGGQLFPGGDQLLALLVQLVIGVLDHVVDLIPARAQLRLGTGDLLPGIFQLLTLFLALAHRHRLLASI